MLDTRGFDYQSLMQKALRGLMIEILDRVAKQGLPGDHHFYIGINTACPGVDIPGWLRERHPRTMVIVLQEWFADLAVLGDRFQVTLNFSNQPQTLVVPFDAVQTFIDPSVKFGLRFDDHDGEAPRFDPAPDLGTAGAHPVEANSARPAETVPSTGPGDDDPGGGADRSARVVSLDQWRKS